MFQINQGARDNFNQKALAILMSLKELPSLMSTPSRVPADAHVTATITDADIIGDITQFATDAKGQICERTFFHNGSRVGLTLGDYAYFRSAAENIQRLNGIRDQVSQKFVEDTLFLWIKEAYQRGSVEIQFIDFLQSCASETVKKIRIYVPMAYTTVEFPFEFGNVQIENISKSLVDEHLPPLDSFPDDIRQHAQQYAEKFRKDFQGYAAIRLDLECEPHYATQLGLERARAVVDLLGIYSGKVLIPDARCSSRLKGAEFIERSNVIMISETSRFRVAQAVVDTRSIETWTISQDELSHYRKCGFEELSDLIKSGGQTDFEKSVLNLAFLYSKSAFTSEPMAKLVYVLSALESILLKNQSEPIQQNLGERLAIFSVAELAKRKNILKNVRTVYELRSRYLHHGHTSSELEEIQTFLTTVWVFFAKILYSRRSFKSKDEFLTSIDDEKFS